MKKFIVVFVVVFMAVCSLGMWSYAELATIKSNLIALGIDPELDHETSRIFDQSTTSLLIYNRETAELMYSFNGLLLYHEIIGSARIRMKEKIEPGSYIGSVKDFNIIGSDLNGKPVIKIATILAKCMPKAFIVRLY